MRKSLILLGILDDSDVEWLLRSGVKQRIPPNGVLVVERQPLESIFIVLSGAFDVTVGTGNRVARLLAGDIVGEMSFIDARLPSATVSAQEDSLVLNIPKESVHERLRFDSGFGARFYRAIAVFLSSRLRDTVSRFGYGKVQLAEDQEDFDEIPEDILENLAIAGHRFTILEERARVVSAG
jgi:CRP/FNR family transcriptional regulator, cyclic AMP receptor protein